jgi:release factor glutamine methyltransferase
LAYLLGEREFHGLMLRVTPDVLVPRPDTELLVDWALELLAVLEHGAPAAEHNAPTTVADLGTGSGAIALALKHARPSALVCAVERSPAALAVAHANGQRLGLPVQWLQGDWFAPLADRRFDLIVSNPPYIDGADAHLAALHAEPIAALTPGPDGLAALRVLARDAPPHLQSGGWLVLEHGHDQGAAVRSLLQAAGLERVQTRRDLGGQERCTAGRHGPA